MKIPVVENVLKLNDEIAELNREQFRRAELFVVDLMGGPGCGKTSLLEATLRYLKDQLRMGVLVGDLTTSRDGDRLGRFCDQVVQINTGRSCHLDANQVRQAARRLNLERLDVLFIENVGNLICPVGFDLGQDAKVGMFSISEGDDKAAKHPHLVTEVSVVLLNKMDLLPHVPFSMQRFQDDVHRLHPQVPVLELSVQQQNVNLWIAWLLERLPKAERK